MKPDLVPWNITIEQVGNWDKNYPDIDCMWNMSRCKERIPFKIYYKVFNQGDAVAEYHGEHNYNYHDLLKIGSHSEAFTPFTSVFDMKIDPNDFYKYSTDYDNYGYASYIVFDEENLGKPINVTLIVDRYDYINESDETNNRMNISITFQKVIPRVPNNPNRVSGPTHVIPGIKYEYTTKTIDPTLNKIDNYSFFFIQIRESSGCLSWNGCSGPFDYGETVSCSHIWQLKRFETCTCSVYAQVYDESGLVSILSDPLPVSISKNKAINPLFLQLLENHPCMFHMLKQLLGSCGRENENNWN